MSTIVKRRITPDEVAEAYRKTRLVPACGAYFFTKGGKACGCPLTALFLDEKHVHATSNDIVRWAYEKLGMDYTDGFVNGVDGAAKCGGRSGPYAIGYSDGQRIRNRVTREFGEL